VYEKLFTHLPLPFTVRPLHRSGILLTFLFVLPGHVDSNRAQDQPRDRAEARPGARQPAAHRPVRRSRVQALY
jgi:hypothetical protein